MKARLSLALALAVSVAPLKASAQAWVGNPNFSEGVGIRAGNLELHPSVGAEFGYDSNFFRAADSEDPVKVLKLRVTPSLTLSTLGDKRRGGPPTDVIFTAGAHASYFELFPLDSDKEDASKRRNVSMGADAKVDIFSRRKIGFDLLAAYVRMIEGEGRTEDLAGEGFNRDTLRGGGGVTWRPGGGNFEWRGGYMATYNFFENDAYDSLANLQHEVNTRGRWRFLPRSALLFDTAYTFIRYTHDDTKQTNGDALRSRVGFHGLVTYHLALLGMLGWATSFYENRTAGIQARQYDSVVANAEARWFIQPRPDLEQATITSGLSSLALGYNRSFTNSYLGSFYQSDRGYLNFDMFLLGAVAAGLQFGVSHVGFPEVVSEEGVRVSDSFSQWRIDARAFGEYRFTDTLATNLTVMYDQVNSPRVSGEELKYDRWQAYLGVRWFM
jgi:hypothetical protein